uniref:Integrase, catalytic region, zinc finger, CCHC-type, peptidase aspartic, catalytic n=1 Tax=Tanacetum cinerariifolium TaxID=118510 RepID=A0A699GKJ5_TANCI|nr:hypothetical protein [Tanacetum cinerariifolium]
MDDTPANIIRDSPSPTDAEIVVTSEKTNNGGNTELMQIDEEQGKDVDEQVNLKENTDEIDQGQAGSDLGITFESRPSPEQVVMDEDQAGPDPGESQDLISLTRTLSSMKNLEDAYVVRDQFINGKSTKDEPENPMWKMTWTSTREVLQLTSSSSVEVSVAPKVGAATVASHARVLKLDTHTSLKAGPLESSPAPVSIAPMDSPFLCSDDFESDAEMPERHVLPTPHDAMLTRWRSRVASRSSSPTTSTPEIPVALILPAPFAIVAPSSEFPLAPVVAPPRIRRRQAILIQPREDIPIGQIYRTHPSRPYRVLIARKSVRPLPSHRLALRYTSHHLDCFTSGSSLGHSSSDHSSSRHSVLARYSSYESSTGPFRKRCRSLAATMTSSIHATRDLVPSRADLLLSRKRFRDFISPKDSVKEGIDTDVFEDIEDNATAIEVAVVRDVVAEVDAAIDIEATNIILQGSPKDIYTLINHYTDAKDIWDNLKMLLEGGQDNVVDEDLDKQSVQDLALNVDNVFQADDCDAFYSDYVKENVVPVVQSSVSSIQNDLYMMILNDMHEQPTQHVSDDTSANIFCDSPSPTDAETVAAFEKTTNVGDTELMQIDEEQGKDVDEQVKLKENTNEIDQGQTGSDLGRTFESRPSPE